MVTSPTAEAFDQAAGEFEPSAAQVCDALELVQRFVKSCDPDTYTGEDAAKMVKTFSKGKRSVAAGELLFARRVQKTRTHETEGHKQVGKWLSDVNGEPVGQAASKMESARLIEGQPEVAEAFKSGDLSEAQAREIAAAAERCPDQASELVKEAQLLTFSELKKRCSDTRRSAGSAEDEIARHERIRKARFCRTWTDAEGAGHLEARMTPDALGVIKANLGRLEKEIFAEARRDGRRESRQAYMADALVAMALAASRTAGRIRGRIRGLR
jgi:hypothetical protein